MGRPYTAGIIMFSVRLLPSSIEVKLNELGTKHFRVMNCWLQHNDFDKLVTDSWLYFLIEGSNSFVHKEKLKLLKVKMRKWNKVYFGNLDDKISNAVTGIKLLDDKGKNGFLEEGDVLKRKELFEDFWRLSMMQDSFMY